MVMRYWSSPVLAMSQGGQLLITWRSAAFSSRSKTRSKPTLDRNRGEKSKAVLIATSSVERRGYEGAQRAGALRTCRTRSGIRRKSSWVSAEPVSRGVKRCKISRLDHGRKPRRCRQRPERVSSGGHRRGGARRSQGSVSFRAIFRSWYHILGSLT